MHQSRTVAVFGSGQVLPSTEVYATACLVGQRLGQDGLSICTGGYGGVMEASSRGAKEAGAEVIGVTCRVFGEHRANQWVDEEIRAETLLQRIQTMADLSHGFIALEGGIGTLTEITVLLSLLQTRSIPARPLVLLARPWEDLVSFCRKQLILREGDLSCAQIASTPADAAELMIRALNAPGA